MESTKDYSHVISGYKNELVLNCNASLSGYCRSVGVSLNAVYHWMESCGLTVKKIKSEMCSSPAGGSSFAPVVAEVSPSVLQDLDMTFPNHVRIRVGHCSADVLLALVNGYGGGRF